MSRLYTALVLLGLTMPTACRISFKKPRRTSTSFNDGRTGKGPALAIISDSLSSGVLASTLLGADLERGMLTQLTELMFTGDHGLEAIQGQFSELENSAATTDQDWGLRASIAKNLNLDATDIPLYYAAKWGGRLSNVPTYLDHLAANYKKRGKPAEYVLLMIGGNDFCHGDDPENFQENLEKQLLSILKLHPQSTVIVATVPIFTDILKYNYTYSPILSCEKFRTHYCRVIFNSNGAATAEGYNDAIFRVVNYYRHIYPGKIYLSTGFESMHLEVDDLCFDCFHLSLKGQKKYASYLANTLSRMD